VAFPSRWRQALTDLPKAARTVMAFAAIGLVWRMAFLSANKGAYTDGILQIDPGRFGQTYWPPLYGLLARLLEWLPWIGREGAARLISLAAVTLIVIPIHVVARRLFGMRAAFWTLVAWTVSPIALRWGVQVMTDMLMAALWMGALAAMLLAVEQYVPELFPADGPVRSPQSRLGNQWLLVASLMGALATLTRYQGILLLPPLIVATWYVSRAWRNAPRRAYSPCWTLLPWLAAPLWLLRQGPEPLINHLTQIGQRASPRGVGFTLLNIYWFQFEEFLRTVPYFFTWGIFGFILYGLFRVKWATARIRWTGWLSLYLAVAVLSLQSIFSSFQSRYLLPLLPLVCLFAGHGLATWDRHCERRPVRFWLLAGPVLGYALVMAILVGVLQGNPWHDLKQAGRYIERELNLSEDRLIHTNERFSEAISGAKLTFWSGGRDVKLLGSARPLPGDLIVLQSAYEGSLEGYRETIQSIRETAPAKVIRKFGRFAYPLLPDLMQRQGSHQNPLALVLRYQPQYFETVILEVLPPEIEDLVAPPPPPPPSAEQEAMLEQLEGIRKEINQLKE